MCVHCLPQGNSDVIFARREALRRCAEKANCEMLVDNMDLSISNSDGQVFLRAVSTVETVSLTKDKVKTQLGARYQQITPSQSKLIRPPSRAQNSQKISDGLSETVEEWYERFRKQGSFTKVPLAREPFGIWTYELLRVTLQAYWPNQVRSYVSGQGHCAGLTANERGPNVWYKWIQRCSTRLSWRTKGSQIGASVMRRRVLDGRLYR